MWKEFKEFAVKGNVIDLAVGVIVGAAFGAIVKSLVDDIIMPPLGFVLGNVDFSNLFLILKEGTSPGPYASAIEAQKQGAVIMKYGIFINTIVSFLIVSFSVFVLVNQLHRLKKKGANDSHPSAPPPSDEVLLLREIRDLLKENSRD